MVNLHECGWSHLGPDPVNSRKARERPVFPRTDLHCAAPAVSPADLRKRLPNGDVMAWIDAIAVKIARRARGRES